jgi:Bacteriophage replication protein O
LSPTASTKSPGYTVNLGLGIHVKVEILDEADRCDDAMIELVAPPPGRPDAPPYRPGRVARQREDPVIAKHDVRVLAARWHEWQPKLKPDEWLLLGAILRRTYGWDEMMDIVSTSQLVAMTGMTERRVQRNMASLLKSGAPVKVLSQESRLPILLS